MLSVGSAALLCTQLLVASCGDGSVIATGDTDSGDADVNFPDVPTDTGGEDVPPDDTLTVDTVVPDTLEPDTGLPDTVVADTESDTVDPDTEVPDTVEPDTTVVDTTQPPAYVDWCRLQWPLDITVGAATSVDVYGRVYVAGLTDLTTGNDTDPDLVGRVGYGAPGSDPADWTSWYDASPNAGWDGSEAANDEYMATIPGFGTTGDYDFAFAFSLDGGANWTYCDRNAGAASDGSANGYAADDAGHATVVADPCSPNPCTAPPSTCNGSTLEIYASPGACTDDAGSAACEYTLDSSTNCADSGDFCDLGTLSCVDDACTPNPCTVAPDSICEGVEKVSYAAPGTCDDTTGTAECTYSESGRVDCTTTTGFCVRGDCRTWRLAGPGDVVITEIMPNPEKVAADSQGEWFEVTNVADVAVNLWGLYVDDDGSDEFTIDGDVVIEPGAYAVVGRNSDTATNGGVTVDYVYSGMALTNDTDSLRLTRDTDVVDYVAWTGDWPVAPGVAIQLDPSHVGDDNADLANWCAAYTGYNDVDTGTPGAANDSCTLTGIWCRLQWPLDETVLAGTDFTVYGRVYVAGVTDATTGNDPNPLLVASVGYGPDGATPDTWTEWTDAAPNDTYDGSEANNDEYMATFAAPSAAGTYDFAYRFSGDGGDTWVYCDKDAGAGSDGSEDGYQADNAGNLGVVLDPCTPNPCTTPPDNCDNNILSVYATPGACTVNGVAASCDYGTPTTTNCDDTSQTCDLAQLACVDDPCDPNPCTTPPAATCEGNEAVTYVATGTCTVDNGAVCTYGEDSRTDCGAQFCGDGTCNDWRFVGQAGDLLITEFMANPAVVADDHGEWFEVKNTAGVALNLRGLHIADNASDNDVTVDYIVDPGDYAVFGVDDNSSTNGGVDVVMALGDGFGLANGGDIITLTVGETVIDQVDYDGTGLDLSITSGASFQLHRDATDNADAHDWCWGTEAYSADNAGTPGADNGLCWLPITWCRLQYPLDETYGPVTDFDAYGRYYVAGLTDDNTTGNDPSDLVRGAFALSAPPVDDNDTLNDPSTWTWVSADLNADYGVGSPSFEANNDEWKATLTTPSTPGDYLLGFRVSGDFGRTWTYCDVNQGVGHDGSEDGFAIADAGQIAVSDPCDPNPCTTPPDACNGDTLSTYANPGTCSVDGAGAASCDYGAATDTDCTTTTGRCDADTATCVECLSNADCVGPFEVCDDTGTKDCVAGCIDDLYEDNDAAGTPTVLATDTLEEDLVICDGDADWFQVSLAVGDTLDVLVEPTFNLGDAITVTIYESDGATELDTDTGGVSASGSFTATTAGDYLVRVSAAAGTTATYDLTVLFANDPCVPNPCTDIPDPVCNGNVLTSPDAAVCTPSGDTYSCDYPTSDTTCSAFCNDGACTDWRYPEITGDLVITEYMADPTVGAAGQWFEVYNPTADPLNLDQVDVFDLDVDSFTVDGDVIVQPGAYFVFGASTDTGANGGVNVDYAWSSNFTLDAAGDEIALSWLGLADLDDIAWDGAWPATTNAATSLDPDVVDTGVSAESTNDVAASWCVATSSYGGGGNLGTPGGANDACVVTWTIGYCRLQHPPTMDLESGASGDVYGRVYIAGLTDQNKTGNDPHASVIGAVGYGPTGSDPTTSDQWTWIEGGPNGGYTGAEENNDEDVASLTAGAAGTYDYAFRFSGDGRDTWLYCDKDGATPGGTNELTYDPAQSGVLTVTAAPIFFSEYIEGGSSNKAIEIFNGGANDYDLSAHGCEMQVWSNANTSPNSPFALTGVLPAGGTYAVCNSSADAALKDRCDQTSGSLSHNGNDTIELLCDGARVDIVGKIGDAAYYAQDVTLHRVCGTTAGNLDGDADFDASQWVESPKDTFDGIGSYRPIVSDLTSAKQVAIEALDLDSKKVVLRNVTAGDVTVTTNWWLCNFPVYKQFTDSDVVIPSGETATFDVPADLALSASVDFELGVYNSGSNFGDAANMEAYLAVNAGGHTRESVAVTAGVWTAGSFVTMAVGDRGVSAVSGATIDAADDYTVFGPYCTVK